MSVQHNAFDLKPGTHWQHSTRLTLLKVDCCRNRQQIGNKLTVANTVNSVADTVDFVAGLVTNLQQLEFDSVLRTTLLHHRRFRRVSHNCVAPYVDIILHRGRF